MAGMRWNNYVSQGELLISDIVMPERDGLESCSRSEDFAGLKVIVMSGLLTDDF
jgi:YesN/AraC family two-component response regulator